MEELQSANGLALADKYYSQYGLRAKELHFSGKKVIGYLSVLGPVEIITASGAVPMRLKGNVSEPVSRGDAYMETIVCPFVRNVFDAAVRGRYSFLDGMVLPHQCDSLDRTNDVWNYTLRLPYWHFLNVPHVTDDASVDFMKEILRVFIGSLERFTGSPISTEALADAVNAHNVNRELMRGLYALRKTETPPISGAEMMKVLVAAMSLPVHESNALIESVIREAAERKPTGNKGKRILLIGDQIDDTAIVEAIESTGAQVVMDDLSIGSKMYWSDVEVTPDPIQGIAERYLRKIKIPTTFVGGKNTYREDLDDRFGHLKGYIRDFNIDAVILFVYKYCDPYGFEVPALKSYIEESDVPVLYLEDEYSTSTLARVKTRIEAFLEMIT